MILEQICFGVVFFAAVIFGSYLFLTLGAGDDRDRKVWRAEQVIEEAEDLVKQIEEMEAAWLEGREPRPRMPGPVLLTEGWDPKTLC